MASVTLIPDAALLLGTLLCGMALEKARANWKRREWRERRTKKQSSFGKAGQVITSSARDAPSQLRDVMNAQFSKQRLLSRTEARVFYCTEQTIYKSRLPWRVMGQVNLGEILASPDKAAFSAINSKRVDLLIIDKSGLPVAAIEYQGGRHYQKDAAARDAVKKEALRRAGVHYIEVTEDHSQADLSAEILRIARIVEPVDRT